MAVEKTMVLFIFHNMEEPVVPRFMSDAFLALPPAFSFANLERFYTLIQFFFFFATAVLQRHFPNKHAVKFHWFKAAWSPQCCHGERSNTL